MPEQRYTLVTIFHEADIGFAELQAASVRRFLPRDLVDEIIVIANAAGKSSQLLSRLRDAYGAEARSIVYVRCEDILDPEEIREPGWWSQQSLKLKASRLAGNDRYLILDAKNHFTAPVTRGNLEAGGLPRLFWHSYAAHPMQGWAERALAFFGLLPESHITHLPQSVTPFPAYTRIARDTLERLNDLDDRPTAVVLRHRRISEFLSYGACLLASGAQPDHIYCFTQPGCVIIWESDVPNLRRLIAEATFTFALHKTAIPKLTDDDRGEVAAFWVRLGLVDTFSAGMELLHEAAKNSE